MKILIVEDDFASRTFLFETMESQGHETCVAEDGEEGLARFNEFQPDLVFSDIHMPKMDGLEMLEEIRKTGKNAIIVMNTAYGCEEYAVKAIRLRANNYLRKPIRHKELLPLLNKYSLFLGNKVSEPIDLSEGTRQNFSMSLTNDVEAIPDTVNLLVQATSEILTDSDQFDVRLGLNEILINSVEHGNLEISSKDLLTAINEGKDGVKNLREIRMAKPGLSHRQVKVVYKLNDTFCEWVITDQGEGFDWKKYLNDCEKLGPLDIDCKGIFLSRFHFDTLEYVGNGNIVRVVKRR
jgi:CheY-like chemotaxis protein